MTKTAMLKWCRREAGLTQQALADAIGVSDSTISDLELKSNRWDNISTSVLEKLNNFFEGSKYWEPVLLESNVLAISEIVEVPKEDVDEEPKVVENTIKYIDNRIEPNDVKALTLIEFAYEGLNEATTHEDFVANINLMKKILAKYY